MFVSSALCTWWKSQAFARFVNTKEQSSLELNPLHLTEKSRAVYDHGLRNVVVLFDVRGVEQLPCARHGEDNCVWTTFCHLRVVCALLLG